MFLTQENLTLIIATLITGLLSPLSLQVMQHYLKRRSDKKKHTLDQNEAVKKDELVTSSQIGRASCRERV